MRYFLNVNNVEELKKQYRVLAMKHHPDRGGDAQTMATINAEYDKLFGLLAAQEANNNDTAEGRESIDPDNFSDDGFKKIIDTLLSLEGLEVELCGSWLWISGDTRTYKNALKAAGCFWASKKQLWYWRPEEAACKRSKGKDMEYIRSVYGSKSIEKTNYRKITA